MSSFTNESSIGELRRVSSGEVVSSSVGNTLGVGTSCFHDSAGEDLTLVVVLEDDDAHDAGTWAQMRAYGEPRGPSFTSACRIRIGPAAHGAADHSGSTFGIGSVESLPVGRR
jgi:hypothetical protein